MAQVAMPKLSDSMEEGTIARWLKADGDDIEVGTELVEIETDKATMTYESEFAGRLHIAVAAGETVPVGAPIAEIARAGEPRPAVPGTEQPLIPAATPLTAVNGGQAVAMLTARTRTQGVSAGGRVKASPVARRVAEELGVDITALQGSGPGGRIIKRDVHAARTNRALNRRGQTNGAGRERAKGAVRSERPTTTQATIARRMSEAKATMPDFALTTEIDMDAALELRAQLKDLAVGSPPSINDLVVKASAVALRHHPRVNASYRDGGFELYERINVGIAVAADDALLVPTIVDADQKSLGEIASETRQLGERARNGRLTPAELAGGTFTVSNLGMYGIKTFTAVINPPQAAILAVGSVEQCPVARDGAIVLSHRMVLTLTCDHRILYGADGAAFLRDVRQGLEQPLRLVT